MPAGAAVAVTDSTAVPSGSDSRNWLQANDVAPAVGTGPADALTGVQMAPAAASGTPAATSVRSRRFMISPRDSGMATSLSSAHRLRHISQLTLSRTRGTRRPHRHKVEVT
ncbi:hypothetical protein GCM10009665_14540 [Kitasatospora nipponensis]|uniref:Uncharacterized protein n=1 Tax=Kitasatospora nipponensis TaxID=258049 RepID=A0ABP4GHE4_9ACTN